MCVRTCVGVLIVVSSLIPVRIQVALKQFAVFV